ncbi:MAG: ATP synthase F1 subunit gamma [Verrucomicrobiae bacterium]|nr:ATP synthase F1 subunit gamma [Verrucomicrobiae bacterium]
MPSTRDIRRRIKSVKNTAQITKAMQMVASAKMRKAQQAALSGRPYAGLMDEVLASVAAHAGDFSHPLLGVREGEGGNASRENGSLPAGRRAIIVISTDKGLCGSLNSNLLREAGRFEPASTIYITAGRKASQFVARTRRTLAAEFAYRDSPAFSEARSLSKFAQELFLKGEVDRVDVLYTQFINVMTQRPDLHPFLPIGEVKRAGTAFGGQTGGDTLQGPSFEYLFEPNPADVFGALLPHYLNFQMYHFLLEAKASEHSARMVAMKSATDNARQLIKDLTLEYNKMRQASITNELLEISSAAMALS